MIYYADHTLYGASTTYPPLTVFLIEADTFEQAHAAAHLIAQEDVEEEGASSYSLGNIELTEWNETMLKPISAQAVLARHRESIGY